MVSVIHGFYKPSQPIIKTKTDLVKELQNLKDVYLRLKELYGVTIVELTVRGTIFEVTNFRRFILDALTKDGFILERPEKFKVNGEIFDQIFYSFLPLQRMISLSLNKRAIAEEFTQKLVAETRQKEPLSEYFP